MSLGFTCGMIDLSNSSHAICLERLLGNTIVGSMQGVNSFGNLLGVLVGGICSANNISPFVHFGLLTIIGNIISYQFFTFLIDVETERELMTGKVDSPIEEEATSPRLKMTKSLSEVVTIISEKSFRSYSSMNSEESESIHSSISTIDVSTTSFGESIYLDRLASDENWTLCGCHKSLFFIGLMGLVNMTAVGSVNNWCTLYFSSTLYTSAFMTSLGYAAFELFVMCVQVGNKAMIIPKVEYIFATHILDMYKFVNSNHVLTTIGHFR